jgi:hypothetical protein
VSSFDDFKARINSWRGIEFNSGNSDPANLLFWERIATTWPDAKWVVVERSSTDVAKACRSVFPEMNFEFVSRIKRAMDGMMEQLNPMRVAFDAITPSLCKEVAHYLCVDIGLRERAEQLCKMNVQVDKAILNRAIRDVIHNPPQWLNETVLA